MPKGLFSDRAEHVELRDYADPPLGPRQYRLKSELGAIKHGTGFHNFGGHSPFAGRRFDTAQRLFVPRSADDGSSEHGQYVGNMLVGRVVEAGPEVQRVKPGDRMFCYGPLTETRTLEECQGEPLDELRAEDAVCLDPALFAYGALRDGRVGLGDSVVLFGLGAIGQFAAQLLRLAGCGLVVAVDPIARRRELARSLGADVVLDPAAEDIALRCRRLLGRGMDIAIEASGHYAALAEAMRCVGQCGRIVTVGFYKGRDSQLELGADFFHNRIELIASLPAWGNPLRDAPLWDNARIWKSLIGLFKAGRITSRGILDPIVDFADSAAAYMQAYRDPASAIKLAVRF